MIIPVFPSPINILNQSFRQSKLHIKNKALVSTIDFRVQSVVSWESVVNKLS